MQQRGGTTGAAPRLAAVVAPSSPRQALSTTPTFARTPARATSVLGTAPRHGQRPCMALLLDAGRSGSTEMDEIPELVIPVARLGKRNASFHYARSAVTVRQGGRTWQVWVNVPPSAVEDEAGPGPRLMQDDEGNWHASGGEDSLRDLPEYEEFCAAANSAKVRAQPVYLIRRWCAPRRTQGRER